MTVIRRVLIALVLVMLLLNVGALGLVKFAAGPKPSEEKSKVVLWIHSDTEAKAAAAMLEKAGYSALVKPAQHSGFVEANFRLAMKASKPELLAPIERVLRNAGYNQLKLDKENSILYYGGVYQSKAEAAKVADMLRAKESLVFDVTPGLKAIKTKSNRVILTSVPSNFVATITDPITAKFTVEEIEETLIETSDEETE